MLILNFKYNYKVKNFRQGLLLGVGSCGELEYGHHFYFNPYFVRNIVNALTRPASHPMANPH